MKEIKFRAWDGENKEMVTFPALGVIRDIDTGSSDLMLGSPDHCNGYEGINYFLPERDVILMQYTGLTDRNGVEIFEGDVIGSDTSKSTGLVKDIWTFEWLQIDVEGELKSGKNALDRFRHLQEMENFDKAKVIGNIYQNPELLQHAN